MPDLKPYLTQKRYLEYSRNKAEKYIKEASALIPVMQAYLDGQQIQYYDKFEDTWEDTDAPEWCSYMTYRVKPTH